MCTSERIIRLAFLSGLELTVTLTILWSVCAGKEISPGKYRVTFVHKREDPLSRGVKERLLYKHFSDFPDSTYTISQVVCCVCVSLCVCGCVYVFG